MKNRVVFYENQNSGPEVGSDLVEVYACFCDAYEPTSKDAQVFDGLAGKNTVTLTIRNAIEQFKPEYYHIFKLEAGYFKFNEFEIKSITPYSDNPNFIKIIGEGVA